MSADEIVTRCPHCGQPFSGLMKYAKKRWHLDGLCVTKKEREKKQKERKNQPPLPLKKGK